MTKRTLTILCLSALACLAGGCGWNDISRTEINVRYSGDTLVHMAHIPVAHEDGSPADAARRELLSELSEYAEAWTLVRAQGAVIREKDQPPQAEEVYLLTVEGPRELAFVLWETLREEFGLARPWLVSLPTQALARVPMQQPAPDGTEEPAEGE
jgi:hypothetical protein